MGIFCEIRLTRPADGKYRYGPGSIVSGAIKYYLDEEYTFTRIIVSMKGIGLLRIENEKKNFFNSEEYIKVDQVIYTNDKNEPLSIGQYETDFSFQLPENIPPSLKFYKHNGSYKIWCIIKYYVRIKLERPGILNLNTTNMKEINVISEAIPRLSIEPLIYGEEKKLMKFFGLCSSKGVVSVKATIASSVVKPGDKVKINCEIDNNTSAVAKGVKINLIEVDKYTISGYNPVIGKTDVEGVEVNYGVISIAEATTIPVDLSVPDNCLSIDHYTMIVRDYAVEIILLLPSPHSNMVLEIPVQVVEKLSIYDEDYVDKEFEDISVTDYSDDPSTNWEAMGEDRHPHIE